VRAFTTENVLCPESIHNTEVSAYSWAVRTVGQNFKRIREAKKLKQEELSKKLGYKRASNVSLIENSARLPEPATIRRMAAVLGCSTSELLDGVETEYDRLRGENPPCQVTKGDRSSAEKRQQDATPAAIKEQQPTHLTGAGVAEFEAHAGLQETINRRYLSDNGIEETIIDAITRLLEVLLEQQRASSADRRRPRKARPEKTPRPRRARA
jgi:transcriptional regulator with XRE-family HTH domain